MSKEYNVYRWSNCLIEAVKAWWKNRDIKFYFLPANSDKIPFFHLAWTDGKDEYSFEAYYKPRHWYTTFWYYGCIRKHNLGWAKKYKRFIERKKAGTLRYEDYPPIYTCGFTPTSTKTKQ